jgi:hypothetical protein
MSRLLAVLTLALSATMGATRSAQAQHAPAEHGAAPTGHTAEAKPAPDVAEASTHKAAATPRASPTPRTTQASARGKKSNESALGSVVTRIQERIAAETGPAAKTASRTRSTPTSSPHGSPVAGVVPGPRSGRLVTLQWRVVLEWPSDVDVPADAPATRPAKIELKW